MVLPQNPEQKILELQHQNQTLFITNTYLQNQLEQAHEKIRHLEVILTDIVSKNDSLFLIKK